MKEKIELGCRAFGESSFSSGSQVKRGYTTCKAQDKTVNYTSPTYDIEIFSPI